MLHRELGGANLGDGADRIGQGGLEAPRGVARVDVALGGKTQDHLLALGVRHHALEDAFDDEVLLHRPVSLVLERFALGRVRDFEQGLELLPLGGAEMTQDQVLPQLQPDDTGFRVAIEGGHGNSLRCGRAAGDTIEYNRKFLIPIKAANRPTAYI